MFFGQPFGGLLPGARGAVLSVLLRTGSPLTGRQIHGMVSDEYSLWSVQEALKVLTQLGVVDTGTVGRAGVHTINETHASIDALRALADPIAMLKAAILEAIDPDVESVTVFGSIGRGEATTTSDIDLALIAKPGWNGRVDLETHVRARLGNRCDVLVFTAHEFRRLARSGEPVVTDIVRDGIPVVGRPPRVRAGG